MMKIINRNFKILFKILLKKFMLTNLLGHVWVFHFFYSLARIIRLQRTEFGSVKCSLFQMGEIGEAFKWRLCVTFFLGGGFRVSYGCPIFFFLGIRCYGLLDSLKRCWMSDVFGYNESRFKL